MVFTIILNTVAGKLLPNFESLTLILHISGFLAILLVLAIFGPHQSPSEVFGTFLDTGGWSTQGLSFFIGIIGSVYTFTGTCFHKPLVGTVSLMYLFRCRWGGPRKRHLEVMIMFSNV